MNNLSRKMIATLCLVATIASTTSVTAFAKTSKGDSPIIKEDNRRSGSPQQVDQRYLETYHSIAWEPYSEINPSDQPYGFFIEKIVYLSKHEAIAVVNGYRDSEFQKQYKTVLDYAWKYAEGVGSAVTGKICVDIAKKYGFNKVAGFFAGASGGFVIGLTVEAYTSILKNLDSSALKDAIDKADWDKFVRVEVGRANDGQYGMRMNRYQAWNSNYVEGWRQTLGSWSTEINIR